MSVFTDLQKWYASNCDGEWEHDYGVKIETLDNPGWGVTVDLDETNLEDREFQNVEDKPSEESWMECFVEGAKFRGFGDPGRLEQILGIFIAWAKSQNEDWLKLPEPLSDKKRQQLEDEQFFNLLDEEIGPELCRHEGCRHKRIQYSVMCRRHHFEMVKGRSVPERAS